MSRTIDVSDPQSLSEADRRYLAERGRLPAGAEPVQLHPDFTPLGVQLNTGTANTLALTTEQLEAELERRRELETKEAERNRETDLEELRRQKSGTASASEQEQYKADDGWTDDRLREELGQRGLSTDGERKQLRARLVKSDRDSE
jgi:hypothetical protein